MVQRKLTLETLPKTDRLAKDTPRTKTRRLLRHFSVSAEIRKSLISIMQLWTKKKEIKLRYKATKSERHKQILARIFARDSIYAKRAYAIAIPSVRLSVCPTHGWISQKRLKLGSCNFHHTVAPSL